MVLFCSAWRSEVPAYIATRGQWTDGMPRKCNGHLTVDWEISQAREGWCGIGFAGASPDKSQEYAWLVVLDGRVAKDYEGMNSWRKDRRHRVDAPCRRLLANRLDFPVF